MQVAVRIPGIEKLLGGDDEWRMSLGERAALEGILSSLKPGTAIEIGTLKGGSLDTIAAHSDVVHSFDLSFHPSVSRNRFPNVVFHEGDSHELLPKVLRELAAAGTNVDLALVDGDHTTAGVRQDLEDLLDSPSVGRTLILVHDTLNERVRMGLNEVDFDRSKVTHVELDFVVGRIWGGASFDHDLWGGLGLVVTGWDLDRDVIAETRPLYDAVDVFTTFRRTLEAGGAVEAPPYGEIRVLEHQLSVLRESTALIEQSLSWRITAPLRWARSLVRR
jgi:hypothetical protein